MTQFVRRHPAGSQNWKPSRPDTSPFAPFADSAGAQAAQALLLEPGHKAWLSFLISGTATLAENQGGKNLPRTAERSGGLTEGRAGTGRSASHRLEEAAKSGPRPGSHEVTVLNDTYLAKSQGEN